MFKTGDEGNFENGESNQQVILVFNCTVIILGNSNLARTTRFSKIP